MQSVQRWNCKGCRKQFSVKVGTIFEESPLGLDKWLVAMWIITDAKNGVSSHEIGRPSASRKGLHGFFSTGFATSCKPARLTC
jgi:hypothetical protein